ncbi:MAG: hypothetical protein [Bacteriophage sp.]|nr:MAG: hypothetical protein [Bacteriophage sp.]
MLDGITEVVEDGELVLEQELLSHQYDFIEDTKTRVLGLASGYGGGKTFAIAIKHIILMQMNPGVDSIFAEPTNSLLIQLAMPALEQVLDQYGITYSLVKHPLPIYTCMVYSEKLKRDVPTRLLCCSMENYKRLVGLNCSHVSLDEFDTTDQVIAYSAFTKLLGRLRAGRVRQMNIVSTPEGFMAMYRIFVSDVRQKPELAGKRRIIHAKTTDNPYVPPDFIENMLDSYDAKLVEAYVEGKFVNLKAGVIYYNYSTIDSASQETIRPGEDLHIGQDFNIGHMASVIYVIRQVNELQPVFRQDVYTGEWYQRDEWVSVDVWHAVDEISDAFDTADTIKILKERYQTADDYHKILIYPDASGKNRQTNAIVSDIAMLEQAGFEVYCHDSNPAVRDRINSVNIRLKNSKGIRRLFVNEDKCPNLSDCLRRQGYNPKTGEPEKGGDNDASHMNDAFGYPIAYNFPIERPTFLPHEIQVER